MVLEPLLGDGFDEGLVEVMILEEVADGGMNMAIVLTQSAVMVVVDKGFAEEAASFGG